jgi:hypothetical protein
LRFDDLNTREPTRVIRPMVGYQASKQVSLWVGYTRVEQFPSGRAQTTENRLFQQLSWNMGKLGTVSLASRTRLEQRFFANGGGSAWRLREQLKASVPLTGSKVSIVVTTEPFVTLQSSVSGSSSGLEQWRSFIGVNVPLTHRVSLEAGYMNRYIVRRNAPDRIDHIFPLTLSYRF